MTNTARLRLAVSLAAAIASSAFAQKAADESGPAPARTVSSSQVGREASAAPKASRRTSYPFRGVVASFEAETRTLKLEGKKSQRVIQLPEAVRLERDGEPAELEELKPGVTVRGTLRRNADGQEEAVLVRIGARSENRSAGDPNREGTDR